MLIGQFSVGHFAREFGAGARECPEFMEDKKQLLPFLLSSLPTEKKGLTKPQLTREQSAMLLLLRPPRAPVRLLCGYRHS